MSILSFNCAYGLILQNREEIPNDFPTDALISTHLFMFALLFFKFKVKGSGCVFDDIGLESLNGFRERWLFITALSYLCRDETHRPHIR